MNHTIKVAVLLMGALNAYTPTFGLKIPMTKKRRKARLASGRGIGRVNAYRAPVQVRAAKRPCKAHRHTFNQHAGMLGYRGAM